MKHAVLIALLAAAAHAQTVRSASNVVPAVNGVIPTGDGHAYVTSSAGQLWLVDLTDFTAALVLDGLPLSAPGRGDLVSDHPWLDDGLVLSDWNSEDDAACCDGRTWHIDADTLDFTTLAEGNPVTAVGDPIACAIAPGGVWGDDVYVIDFEGASPDEPVLFRITEAGPEPFLQDAALWDINHSPNALAFDAAGDYGGDLFVLESFASPGPEAIIRIEPDASWSHFFDDPAMGKPRDITFGAGAFGDDMYVLFESAGNGAVYRITPGADAEFVADGLCDGGEGGLWALAYDPALDALVAGTGDNMHVISFDDAGCYPDCNADGALNILDFVCFQASFLAGEIEADCNNDCSYTILDFVCFQNAFVTGCP